MKKTDHSKPADKEELLSAKEENFLRMRHGFVSSKDTVLTSKTQRPDLKRMLLALELRAFQKSGRLAEILEKDEDF